MRSAARNRTHYRKVRMRDATTLKKLFEGGGVTTTASSPSPTAQLPRGKLQWATREIVEQSKGILFKIGFDTTHQLSSRIHA
mmetsp:Transcript_38454/g.43899  ORF Transcript_38454/g.43899 Transcript_38454/m.43899 type:complete len:82 (+) Transcript_38454:45-290(+)